MEDDVRGGQQADEAADRAIIEESLTTVEGDAAAQRELLDRGLQLTDKWRARGSLETEEGRCWVWQRLRLLQRSERLGTLQELSRGGYAAEAYRALCDVGLLEAAASLAAAGHVEALLLLLRRHPYVLAPSVLAVASALPETLEPKSYLPLLRAVAALGTTAAPALAREPDWAETQATVDSLRQEGEPALLTATEPLAQLALGWAPPTQRQRAEWLAARALAVDRATGQLSIVSALLAVGGAALGAAEDAAVASLLAAARELGSLVELETGRGGEGWRRGLEQYLGLDAAGRLAALAGTLGAGDLEEDIEEVLVPFLDRTLPDPRQRTALLTQLLERETAVRLLWVVKLVQLESERLAAFRSAADLAGAATAAVYACRATDAWGPLESMLGAVQEAVENDAGLTGPQAEAAAAALRMTRRQLTAARLLTKHGLPTPVADVCDSDRSTAERLVRTLLARVARSKNTESRWVEVWMDLQAVAEQGLTALSEGDVRTELCRALLRCGQFRLARTYLDGLEPAAAERVVVAAGRDFFLSAGALDAPEVAQARACLELLPGSDAARHELRAITAAQRLQGLGVSMPPAALRAGGGGRALLEAVLASHPELLGDVGSLLQLMEILGCAEEEVPQALAQAALAALEAGDVGQAEGLALQLAKQGHGAAWEVASRVAQSERCSSVESKAILLAFALRHADAGQLDQLLHSWQAADVMLWGAEAWVTPDPDRAGDTLLHPLSDGICSYFEEAVAAQRGGGAPGAAPLALACLLAWGSAGAERWDEMLEDHRGQLSHRATQQALALPATAFALLALEPATLPLEQLEEQAADARRRMGASPRQLLEQLSTRGAAAEGAGAKPAQLVRSVSAASTAGDSTASAADTAGQAAESASRSGLGPAAAAAAQALAECYRRRLVESADEQRVAQLLPGVDAARLTTSSNPAAQRQVVLQLAAAAGRTAVRRDAAPAQASTSATSSEPPSPSCSEEAGEPLGRKNGEAAEATVPQGGLLASRAGGLLAEALSLGERYHVPAWEVQLQYIESLLTHNQTQLETVQEAVQLVWGQLLEEHAEAVLAALASPVYAATSSDAAGHLCFCLDLMRQCCGQLAAQQPTSSVPWGVLTLALRDIRASASGLAEAAPGIDAKAFIAPLMAQLAYWVGSSMDQPAATGRAAQREQVAARVVDDNAQEMADCLESLSRAYAALAAAQTAGEATLAGDYDLGRTTPFMGLLLNLLPALSVKGGAGLQQCQDLMQHLASAEVAAAASFAALGGPHPWGVSSTVDLPEAAQEGVLEAALAVLDSRPLAEESETVQQQAAQLRQRHAQLAALADVLAQCTLSAQQLHLVRSTIAQLPSQAAASAALVDRCLQDLLTDGCPALGVHRVASACLDLAQLPADGEATAECVAGAARAAVMSALQAMAGQEQAREPPLSAGDAVQNLFGILRSANTPEGAADDADASLSLDSIRTLVWGLLQQHATAYDASGDAAATEAHVQVLELLGALGRSMWRGWAEPAEGAAAAGFSHQHALLFSRTAAALAPSWPAAAQGAGITAASFADAEAAEAAVLRLVECAEGGAARLEGVALVLREVLPDAFPPAEGGVAALHRCWAACLRELLSAGRLALVLQSLDHCSAQPGAALLALQEAEGLAEAADASHGAAAAAAVAALTPYRHLQRARWELLFAACDGGALASDIAALPGITAALALLVLQQQLPGIASSRLAVFQALGAALLLGDAPATTADCGAGLTARNALALAAVAQLSGHQLYGAAAWLGMRCIGTHPLLRVLDSGPRVLLSLLRPRSTVALPAGIAEALEAPRTVEAILQALPEQCAAGLAQLKADIA